MDIELLPKMIEQGDIAGITAYMEYYDLEVKDGVLIAKNKEDIEDQESYWDDQSLVKKIGLNQIFGQLTNPASTNYDIRLGASCTLSGRATLHHQGSKINEILGGGYAIGDFIVYGDSVDGGSIIRTDHGDMTISELFSRSSGNILIVGDKEYAHSNGIKVVGYDPDDDSAILTEYNFVMRHRTNKQKWKITLCDGNAVIVTNDHSMMVERDGILMEVKPADLLPDDVAISIV